MATPGAPQGYVVDADLARELRALYANNPVESDPVGTALRTVLDAERWRRGAPDPVSGAFHLFALTRGELVKEEYDAALHGPAGGFSVDALLVDLVAFTLFNQRHGFQAGDQALRAVAGALREACPAGKVVRTHADCFALLLGPTAQERATDALLARAEAAVRRALEPWGREQGLTWARLSLSVVAPSHWQVLGPLLWAECERAMLTEKRVPGQGVQPRRLVLDALTPDPR